MGKRAGAVRVHGSAAAYGHDVGGGRPIWSATGPLPHADAGPAQRGRSRSHRGQRRPTPADWSAGRLVPGALPAASFHSATARLQALGATRGADGATDP